jgi:hypothetical protein
MGVYSVFDSSHPAPNDSLTMFTPLAAAAPQPRNEPESDSHPLDFADADVFDGRS